jgi:hypothetical protein
MADVSRDHTRSQAILFGTAAYLHLTPVPAALNSLTRMEALLTGDLCGWPRDRVSVFADQPRPGDLPDQLVQLFQDAQDVALFYYVGHGQVDPSGTLCLGLVESRMEPTRRRTTSLPFDAVRHALTQSRAQAKIVILDCCYAGLAAPGALAGGDVLDRTHGTGAYTLAAAGEFALAWFETDESIANPQTYFTKYFADVVERGIPGEGPRLRLEPIFHEAAEALARDGKPIPTGRATGYAPRLVFARNAASTKNSVSDLLIGKLTYPGHETALPTAFAGTEGKVNATTEDAHPAVDTANVPAEAANIPATIDPGHKGRAARYASPIPATPPPAVGRSRLPGRSSWLAKAIAFGVPPVFVMLWAVHITSPNLGDYTMIGLSEVSFLYGLYALIKVFCLRR